MDLDNWDDIFERGMSKLKAEEEDLAELSDLLTQERLPEEQVEAIVGRERVIPKEG